MRSANEAALVLAMVGLAVVAALVSYGVWRWHERKRAIERAFRNVFA